MSTTTPGASGRLRPMNDHELERLVKTGRERDSWLAMSSYALDQAFRSNRTISYGESAQEPMGSGLGPIHEWTDHLDDNPSASTLAPIRVALTSLTVGDPTTSSNKLAKWASFRNVDVRNQPNGYNIHLNIVQDKMYKAKYPASNASVETTLNIIDGVIVVKNFAEPEIPTARRGDALGASDRLPFYRQLHEILFMAWVKLHLPVRSDDTSHAEKTGYKYPLGKTVSTSNDATLSQRFEIGTSLSLREMESMLPWLNWIVINKPQDALTLQIMRRCFESRGYASGYVPHYHSRETFKRGHWGFYALLATEIGKRVTNFLALHKDNRGVDTTQTLGIKIIESITIFKPEDSNGLTDQQRELYVDHPAIIFEIKDDNAMSDLAKRNLERSYMHAMPEEGFPNIGCTRI